jgi:hypothetical protein
MGAGIFLELCDNGKQSIVFILYNNYIGRVQ